MRTLTNEELTTVAGGRGINIGDVLSGNSTGNGNSVDAGGNSLSADGNGSGNSANASASTTANTSNSTHTMVTSLLDNLVGGIL